MQPRTNPHHRDHYAVWTEGHVPTDISAIIWPKQNQRSLSSNKIHLITNRFKNPFHITSYKFSLKKWHNLPVQMSSGSTWECVWLTGADEWWLCVAATELKERLVRRTARGKKMIENGKHSKRGSIPAQRRPRPPPGATPRYDWCPNYPAAPRLGGRNPLLMPVGPKRWDFTSTRRERPHSASI